MYQEIAVAGDQFLALEERRKEEERPKATISGAARGVESGPAFSRAWVQGGPRLVGGVDQRHGRTNGRRSDRGKDCLLDG